MPENITPGGVALKAKYKMVGADDVRRIVSNWYTGILENGCPPYRLTSWEDRNAFVAWLLEKIDEYAKAQAEIMMGATEATDGK